MTRVLCAGLVTVDVIHRVRRVPEGNAKLFDDGQSISVGGPAANAARTVAALGARARLVAAYGDSPVTAFLAGTLADEGIQWVDPLAGSPNPTPVSSVLIDIGSGDRAVIAGGTRTQTYPLAPNEWLDGVDAVLIDGHGGDLPAAVARAARQCGIPVVLDGGSYKETMSAYLGDVDLALLSEDFLAPQGDSITWALRAGAWTAGRSAGPGAIDLDGALGRASIPVPSVPVVDTLGAGDVLHGACAAALGALGDRERIPDAVSFASRVATASVGYPGALGWARDDQLRDAFVGTLRRLGLPRH